MIIHEQGRSRLHLLWAFLMCLNAVALGQQVSVTGRVEFAGAAKDTKSAKKSSIPPVVVWLSPLDAARIADPPATQSSHLRLAQKNKQFEPHILVVPVGAAVEFPNLDPWFHNVFSLFDGKRFDLGLYEAGDSRIVHFDREGVSYIFCNIHPQMSGVVVALKTPYWAISDGRGDISFSNVPLGRYMLHIWSEMAAPEILNAASRQLTITQDEHALGTIRIATTPAAPPPHKNKYGRDYDPQNGSYN